MEIISEQIPELTIHKISEIFEISPLDTQEVKQLLAAQLANAEAVI